MKTLSKSYAYFVAFNAVLAMLLAISYFEFLPEFPTDFPGAAFLITSVVSHMALLALVASAPLWLLIKLPKPKFIALAAVYFSLFQSALFIDTLVFEQYKFHINPAIMELILAGGMVDFPLSTYLLVAAGVLLFAAVQAGVFVYFSRSVGRYKLRLLPKLSAVFMLCLLASHALHIWGAAYVYQPITSVRSFLPAFYPATANGFMNKRGWIDQEKLAQQKAFSSKRRQSIIHYPQQPLVSEAVEQPVNIMFLLIDSWRFDTMNASNTPNIWALAEQGVVFNNHLSSGNSTTTGIFGFFYGLHGTYWHNVLNSQIPPVLIERLQALDYQIGVFASAQLYRPEFNHTVFTTVPNLRIESDGRTPAERDRDTVDDWREWHQAAETRNHSGATFSFLFFDAAHGYDIPPNMERKFVPENAINYLRVDENIDRTPIFNRYKNSVYYMDALIGEVIEELKVSGEFANTLFVISGDHGQEVNDTLQNNWGHNSNFTDWQIKTPMILAGPQAEQFAELAASGKITHHTDIAPTLLRNYLGVNNPVADFASGVDWAEFPAERPWVLSAAYNKFAIVTDDLIFEVDPQGHSKLLDKNDRPAKGKNMPAQYIQQALQEISRFKQPAAAQPAATDANP